jgi:Beta-galactosidase/beta-glucuronidase
MKWEFKTSIASLVIISVLFVILSSAGETQNAPPSVPGKRVRNCFDFNWMFHKGDIAIKYNFKAGKYGGLTDSNVNIITDEATVIDYTDVKKPTSFKPADWQKVDLPHDWCVEGTFVNDNSLGGQPAATGFLPTGMGFYRKEFEIPEEDKGKKISIEFDGIYRNSSVWVNGNFMGNHPDGYTPSYYDLTDVLRYGRKAKILFLSGLMVANLKDGGMKAAVFTGMSGLQKPTGCMSTGLELI